MRLYLNTLSLHSILPALVASWDPRYTLRICMSLVGWNWLHWRSFPVLVADDKFTSDGRLVEVCGSHKVVVLGFLVCGDKYSEGLANVDIKRVVVVKDDNLILAIAFYVFAIDEDTIELAERSTTVQLLLESGEGLGVPVTHENVGLYSLECEKHYAATDSSTTPKLELR
ncbi:hypothetical protein G2W53_017469 [Senna tora]|uniref:Uncharacterized protein n=1 Tax=Senna tora TaxID=362788 RepID=A0A834TQF8_9FABA|nr:hypothetical protein G2W53_017469 [Senna tora]